MRMAVRWSDGTRRAASLWLLVITLASAASLGYFAYSTTSGIRLLGPEGVVRQSSSNDCVPACLQMIFSHLGQLGGN